jgi:hypothetical protein
MTSELQQFVGTEYQFSDGAILKIIQIKPRDTGFMITYETIYPDALPRRLVMMEGEFIQMFGHLFVS